MAKKWIERVLPSPVVGGVCLFITFWLADPSTFGQQLVAFLAALTLSVALILGWEHLRRRPKYPFTYTCERCGMTCSTDSEIIVARLKELHEHDS